MSTNKIKHSAKAGHKKYLSLVLALVLLLTALAGSGWPKANESNKERIVHQVAQKWIEVGLEQYRRGFYKVAEQSFLRAQDYQEYLTSAEREKLTELLEKAHMAALERQAISENIQAANRLAEQGQLIEAKTHLEKIKDNQLLTKDEQDRVTEELKKINAQLDEQKKGLPVLEAVEAPLPEVEAEPVQRVQDQMPEYEESAVVRLLEPEITEPLAAKGGYIQVINRKRNILQSHTRAVVNDAVAKAQSFVSEDKFDEAKEAIETAEGIVNKNRLHLGDELFEQYSRQLRQLSEQIGQGQNQRAQQLREQKQLQAIEAQRQYREQMEADRQKKTAELMENAMAYQKQQRYEEALGQLESLLAIEPLNNMALTQKQMLEDTISFRKQLEVHKRADRGRVDVLWHTDEAGIPYAEELTYPKNWREIAAKRKPEEVIGQDPANIAVYKQLDEIVDLSGFSPEMSFGRAIEELKNSVEPPLKINVRWRDLFGVDIDQTTPINMDAIPAVPLGTGLKILLKSVSGEFVELGYVVEDGIITIATVENLPGKMTVQVYDITDLLGAAANFSFEMEVGGGGGGGRGGGGGGGGGRGGSRGGGGAQGGEEELLGTAAKEQMAAEIIQLIQESVDPESWYERGGEGNIRLYATSKLVVRQTPESHKAVKNLLNDLRKTLGQQIAIEARFLTVTENFLEDIGLDMDFIYNAGGKWGLINFQQGSSGSVIPRDTGITGSLGFKEGAPAISSAINIQGSYGSIALLDDLEVNFLLRATQAHRDSKALTAPKVTVLSGESAAIRVETEKSYVSDYDFEDITVAGEGQPTRVIADPEIESIFDGVVMNVTPTISADKKYVILRITTSVAKSEFVDFPIPSGVGEQTFPIVLPEQEVAEIMTRVSVPDGGTLLIGGQHLTGEAEMEEGVPVLSKIPILGRLFENRSKIKDQNILLILVKPTIILQEEAEAEAVAAMEF